MPETDDRTQQYRFSRTRTADYADDFALPDLQIQVLHIVQEALSNVRKHARASHVWLDVQQQPRWRFEVRDDGIGFKTDDPGRNETHVGLRIMAERAERIGATLEVISTPGHGSSVVLELAPMTAHAAQAPREEAMTT